MNDTLQYTNRTSSTLSGIQVLIADDSPTNLDLISFWLEQTGAGVTSANNGQEAVESVEQFSNIDVVLMDIQMPVLDGLSATKKLRENGFDNPIIALTANTTEGVESRCIDWGCSAYIPKPIDADRLTATISELHGRHQLLGRLKSTSFTKKLTTPVTSSVQSKPEGSTEVDSTGDDSRDDNITKRERTADWTRELPAKGTLRNLAIKFARQVRDSVVPSLEPAIEKRDVFKISSVAHRLKGTSGSVGLMTLYNRCREIEAALKEAQWSEIEVLVAQIGCYLGPSSESA